jgi:hypothetical protein
MIRDLAELAHQGIVECGGSFELIKEISEGNFGNTNRNLTDGIRNFIQRGDDTHRRLLFKAELRFANKDPEFMRYLNSVGVRFLNYHRGNKLDIALCSIRDCFLEYTPLEFGFQLDEHGKQVRECAFRGRGTQEAQQVNKIHVDVDNLVPNLRKLIDVKSDITSFLEESGADFSSEIYENLFAFYQGETGLDVSVRAWQGVMSKFNVDIGTGVVRNHLKSLQGSRFGPDSHRDVIDNFDEVKIALESCTDSDCEAMRKMLRE